MLNPRCFHRFSTCPILPPVFPYRAAALRLLRNVEPWGVHAEGRQGPGEVAQIPGSVTKSLGFEESDFWGMVISGDNTLGINSI